MRPGHRASVADQHHPAVHIGVSEIVVDRLNRHFFERARSDHSLVVRGKTRGHQRVQVRVVLIRHFTGRDRGWLGEVELRWRWRVNAPVHSTLAGVGAAVEVGDRIDDAVTAIEADVVPGVGLGSTVDCFPMLKPGLGVVTPPQDVARILRSRLGHNLLSDHRPVPVGTDQQVEALRGAVVKHRRHPLGVLAEFAQRHAAVVLSVVHTGSQGPPQDPPVVVRGGRRLGPEQTTGRGCVGQDPPAVAH